MKKTISSILDLEGDPKKNNNLIRRFPPSLNEMQKKFITRFKSNTKWQSITEKYLADDKAENRRIIKLIQTNAEEKTKKGN